MNTINNFKPFQTITGYNLLEEINNITTNKTCIVTMEDLWDIFKLKFKNISNIYFISSLEETNLEKESTGLRRELIQRQMRFMEDIAEEDKCIEQSLLLLVGEFVTPCGRCDKCKASYIAQDFTIQPSPT